MHRVLVEGSPQLSATAPAQTTIGAVAAIACAANPKRKSLIIQNTGTTQLYFVLGTTDPTATVYTFCLKGGTGSDDGLGGFYFDDAWVGEVRVISSGAGGTYVLTEIRTGSPDWNASGDYGIAGY